MDSILQVKIFDDVTSGDPTEKCNEFLKKIGIGRIHNVTPLYNSILGGVVFVVAYYE